MITDRVTINDMMFNLTLSWGEPFNNFDPILSYTVSCSSDGACPPNFNTTDNSTRSYTITNLTLMNDYTFLVNATNSVGTGDPGVVMITAPSCKCYCITMLENNEFGCTPYLLDSFVFIKPGAQLVS